MKWLLFTLVFNGPGYAVANFDDLPSCQSKAELNVREAQRTGQTLADLVCVPYDPRSVQRFRFDVPGRWEGAGSRPGSRGAGS